MATIFGVTNGANTNRCFQGVTAVGPNGHLTPDAVSSQAYQSGTGTISNVIKLFPTQVAGVPLWANGLSANAQSLLNVNGGKPLMFLIPCGSASPSGAVTPPTAAQLVTHLSGLPTGQKIGYVWESEGDGVVTPASNFITGITNFSNNLNSALTTMKTKPGAPNPASFYVRANFPLMNSALMSYYATNTGNITALQAYIPPLGTVDFYGADLYHKGPATQVVVTSDTRFSAYVRGVHAAVGTNITWAFPEYGILTNVFTDSQSSALLAADLNAMNNLDNGIGLWCWWYQAANGNPPACDSHVFTTSTYPLLTAQWKTMIGGGGGGPTTHNGSAHLTDTSTVVATGHKTAFKAAHLTNVSSITVTGHKTTFKSAALTGSGTLSATGVKAVIHPGSVSLSGLGSLSAAGKKTRFGIAALSGAGSLLASGQTGTGPRQGSASLSGAGSLIASGIRTAFRAAHLTATGSLTAHPGITTFGTAHLVNVSSLAVTGKKTRFGVAHLTIVSTLLHATGTDTPASSTPYFGLVRRNVSLQEFNAIPTLANAQAMAKTHWVMTGNTPPDGGDKFNGFADDIIIEASNPADAHPHSIILMPYCKGDVWGEPVGSSPDFPDRWYTHSTAGGGTANRTSSNASTQFTNYWIMQPDTYTVNFTDTNNLALVTPTPSPAAVYPNWRSFHSTRCANIVNAYNASAPGSPLAGAWLDSLGGNSLNGQVVPGTSTLYTTSNWYAILNTIPPAVKAKLAPGQVVFGNGISGNPNLQNFVDGLMIENWIRAATDGALPTACPTDAKFTTSINNVLSPQLLANPVIAQAYSKLWVSLTAPQQEQWRQFLVVSYFIANEGNLVLDLAVDNPGTTVETQPWAINQGLSFNVDLKAAMTSFTTATGYRLKTTTVGGSRWLYGRRYVRGFVLVNVDPTNSTTYTLPRADYLNLDGSAAPQVYTIPAASGVILTATTDDGGANQFLPGFDSALGTDKAHPTYRQKESALGTDHITNRKMIRTDTSGLVTESGVVGQNQKTPVPDSGLGTTFILNRFIVVSQPGLGTDHGVQSVTLFNKFDSATAQTFVSGRKIIKFETAAGSEVSNVSPLRNSFESGQPNGTAVTTGNSATVGNNPLIILPASVTPPTYDTSTFAHGTLSANLTIGSIIGSPVIDMYWVINGAAQNNGFGRAYVNFGRLDFPNFSIQDEVVGNSTIHHWGIGTDVNGHLVIRDQGNNSQATSVATLSANTWYRLEWQRDQSTLTVRFYASPDSSSITETLSANVGGLAAGVHFINLVSNTTVWFDDIGENGATWFGPAGSTVISAHENATGTDFSSKRVFTVTNPAIGSDSSNLKTKSTRTDTAVGTETSKPRFIHFDSATSIESGLARNDILSSDAALGTDAGHVTIKVNTADSSLGSDIVARRKVALFDAASAADLNVGRKVVLTDSGTGSEIVTKRAIVRSDTGLGTDFTSIHKMQASDKATGLDAVGRIVRTVTDSGSATDTSKNIKRLTDTATASDTSALTAHINVFDNGLGIDVSAVNTPGNNKFLSRQDTGFGVDFVFGRVLVVTQTGGDTETSTPPVAKLPMLDHGTGTEVGFVHATFTLTDSASGSDKGRQIRFADSGTATDTSKVTIDIFPIKDSGLGTDSAVASIKSLFIPTVDSGLSLDAVTKRKIALFDSAIGIDHFTSTLIHLARSDSALGTEAPTKLRHNLFDNAVGVDHGVVIMILVKSTIDFGHSFDHGVRTGIIHGKKHHDKGKVISGAYMTALEEFLRPKLTVGPGPDNSP